MVKAKLAGIIVFIAACFGVIAFGAIDAVFLGGPERSETNTPGRLQPALSQGEWLALAGQETLRVQQAAVGWEAQMGQALVGDSTQLQASIDELSGRARDARAELNDRPLEPREREERSRTVAALDLVIAGLDEQTAALQAGDLDQAIAEGEDVRAALALLRSAPSPQER